MVVNWQAVSAISEIVATIAVVASLWYIAAQLRQNTKAIKASSRLSMLDGDLGLFSHFIDHGIDPHLIGDHVKLSPEDGRRFTWLIVKALRIREFAWHQFQDGMMDDHTWESYMAPVPGIFSTKRAQAVLDFYVGSPDFMAHIHERLAQAGVISGAE